jgi:dTDP-4-amino-4,6-dideoxygalactose transaminase
MTLNNIHIPMLDLRLEYEYMKKDIDDAIRKCLEHQKWILGPEVKEFEDKIAEYIGVKYCIGCSSGTDALVLALRALAIKLKGREYFDRTDEIITTPFTFTATGDAILRAGATPVFVDIDMNTYNIDPVNIREYLAHIPSPIASCYFPSASDPKPLAISPLPIARRPSKVVGVIPVHLYGQSCQMEEIMQIAADYNLFVVEDVAQAFGGEWKGKKLGSIGTVGTFSFFPSKNLGGFGDGGMVSTNDVEIAELVRMLLKHGGKDKYNVDHIGYNARLDTLHAAILLAKFKYIDEFNDRRRKIAALYTEGLKDVSGLVLPIAFSHSPSASDPSPSASHSLPIAHSPLPIASDPSPLAFSPSPFAIDHVFHQYTVRVLNGKRDNLQQSLKEHGISTMVYYPYPLHKMKVFGDGRSKIFGNLNNSEEACNSVLSLPVEPLQKEEDISYIVDCVKSFLSPASSSVGYNK